MMRNLFLIAGGVAPSSRWQEAFADGVSTTWDDLISSQAKAEVFWLSASVPGWNTLLAAVLRQFPDAVAVVVSNAPDEREAMSVMAAGAHAYCHAWSSPEQLRGVAQVVSQGGYWIGPALMSKLIGVVNKHRPVAEELPKELSGREAEVAREVVTGRSNKEIATSLGITERTVKAHLGSAFAKLGVRDRLQLALRLTGDKEE